MSAVARIFKSVADVHVKRIGKRRTRWTKHSLDRRSSDAQGLISWLLKEPAGFHKGAKLSGCKGISENTRRLIRASKDKDWIKLTNMTPNTGKKGEKA